VKIEHSGKNLSDVVDLSFSTSRSGKGVAGTRRDETADRVFKRMTGEVSKAQGRPRSFKEALAMPIPGFDLDLDELIGPRDEPSLSPPIDFSSQE
jgi:hypothetical protein